MSRKRTISLTAGAVLFLTAAGLFAADGKGGDAHPLDRFLKIAKESQAACAKVSDYTAVFRKMEVVRGKRLASAMSMKFRAKPFSVYLFFVEEHRGRQVLYVHGQNMGKIVARQPTLGGLGVTATVDPTGPRAMAEGRFPITKIGIANMLDAIVDQWQSDRKSSDVKVTFYPDGKLKRPDPRLRPIECKVLESKQPRPRRGVEFHITRLYIEKKTNLPVRVEQYGFPPRPGASPPLLGEYTYWNLNTNVGLKDIDFDRRNPKYGF